MPQKPKARKGPSKAKSKDRSKGAKEKTQAERFIETARAIGVDESGREFEDSLRKMIPKRGRQGVS